MGNNQPGGAAPSGFQYGRGQYSSYPSENNYRTNIPIQSASPPAASHNSLSSSPQDNTKSSLLTELGNQVHELEAKRREVLDRVAAKKKLLKEEQDRCGQKIDDVEKEIEARYNEAVTDMKAKYEEELKKFTERHRISLAEDVAELNDVTFEERKLFVKEDANSYVTFWMEDEWDKRLEILEKQWDNSLVYTLRVSKEEHEKVHRQTLARYESEIAELERQVRPMLVLIRKMV
jgi:hypothetical protein